MGLQKSGYGRVAKSVRLVAAISWFRWSHSSVIGAVMAAGRVVVQLPLSARAVEAAVIGVW